MQNKASEKMPLKHSREVLPRDHCPLDELERPKHACAEPEMDGRLRRICFETVVSDLHNIAGLACVPVGVWNITNNHDEDSCCGSA